MSAEQLAEVRYNLRAEWGKTWSVRVPALWLTMTIVLVAVTASSLANDAAHAVSIGELPAGIRVPVIDAFGPAVAFAQLTIAAFAIHLVTPEYASGSMDTTFAAQPRRWVVVGSKAVIASGSGLALGLVLGPVTVAGVEFVLGGLRGDSVTASAAAVGMAAVFAVAAVVGVSLAFLVRSAVVALSLSFLLLVVTLAAPERVGEWLPGQAGATWVEGLAAGRSSWGALAVLGLWAVGLLAIAAWLVRRRDA